MISESCRIEVCTRMCTRWKLAEARCVNTPAARAVRDARTGSRDHLNGRIQGTHVLGPPWKFVSSPRRDASILKRDFYASWNILHRVSPSTSWAFLPWSLLGLLRWFASWCLMVWYYDHCVNELCGKMEYDMLRCYPICIIFVCLFDSNR